MPLCLLATIGMNSVVRSSGQFHLGPEESRSDILMTKIYYRIASLHRRCHVYTLSYSNHRECCWLTDAGVLRLWIRMIGEGTFVVHVASIMEAIVYTGSDRLVKRQRYPRRRPIQILRLHQRFLTGIRRAAPGVHRHKWPCYRPGRW